MYLHGRPNLSPRKSSSIFLEPLYAASYRGHVDIVKLLAVDEIGGVPNLRDCLDLILGFAIHIDHTESLEFAFDPSRHKWQLTPGDFHKV